MPRASQETLALLAFAVAQAVDAVRTKTDNPDSPRLKAADELARALSLDTASWFTAGVDNYFGRISSAQIIAALCEAQGRVAGAAMSKDEKGRTRVPGRP